MAFDALNRYVANHKTWDHVGNMIPVVEASEGDRPHGEFKPAAWLPTQFFEKFFEEYYVVLPGKVIACDNQGRLVPAQYGLSAPDSDITYTSTDVDAGVLDVRTGVALLTAGIGTFTVASVTDFMATGAAMAVGSPIGVAPYAYFQWGGDGTSLDDGFNPAAFRRHNHNLQSRVALLCDYVLELPLIPGETASEAISEDTNTDNRSTFDALANLPVAKNTVRTTITFANNSQTDAVTRWVREVTAATDVVTAGDWHIDLATGVLTVYSVTALGATAYSVTYTNYATTPAAVSRFASVIGDPQCGDFLVTDLDSNWIVNNSASFRDIMGQVLEVEDIFDKDALGRVRTAFNPALDTDAAGTLPGFAGQTDQMPGSATGGVTDKVHYAGAANLVVRVNLVSR